MAQYLSIDWEADDLTGVEASVSDANVRIRRTFNLVWPEHIKPQDDAAGAGQWLAQSLKGAGATAEQAMVVLPREAVVVRRLDLPNAPDAELPDLVRFQAATKSSMPLERLVLDFMPLPVDADADHRQVLMVTVDGARLSIIRNVLVAAGLELVGVGLSAVAVAELVTRIQEQQTPTVNQATLVVYQDTHRVEITILQQQRVVFTHHTRLAGSIDAGGIRASIAEINRASIALSQSQHDVEISQVCLVHAGDADPALEQALAERFAGTLNVLDVADARGLTLDSSVDRGALASFAPAVGMLLSQGSAQVPAIDFLHPRKRAEKKDQTKLQLGLAAAGILLLGGIGYAAFRSHLSSLENQTQVFEAEEAELKRTVNEGKPELEAASRIGEWIAGGRDPLSVLEQLRTNSPGTARLYLKEYQQFGGGRDSIARITGLGYSKTREDVEDLQETLEQAGFRVLPNVTIPSRIDPDYPYEFQLELNILESTTSSTKPTTTRS